ncbi:MAG: XdhC family protein [Rhizobiaceae bacterium]
MDPQILIKLNQARKSRAAAIVVTYLADGRGRLILEGDQVEGGLGEEISKVFLTGKSSKVEVAGEAVFLNVHVPSPRLIAIGAVHISQALAPMAQISGYEMTVIDPRTAFATKERFDDTELRAEWPEDVFKERKLDPYTALVAVTHDPKIDDFPIMEALKAGCFYVGALGSRKTHGKRVERLSSQGVYLEHLDTIHAPIGLDIGAASPQEIAVSIMAEVIQSFRNRGTMAA